MFLRSIPRLTSRLCLRAMLPIALAQGLSAEGWEAAPSLPVDRMGLHSEAIAGTVYVLGGNSVPHRDETSADRVFALPSDAAGWQERAPMPTPRGFFGTAAIGQEIYAIGGSTLMRERDPALAIVEIYDTVADRWRYAPPLQVPRADLAASTVDGRIYAIGGTRKVGIDALGTVEMFDPAIGVWTRRRDMPTPRLHHTSVAHEGRIYVFGGSPEWPVPLATVEIYDPETDQWSKGANMPTPRTGLWATVLGGRIYLAGGLSWENEALTLVEIYDPEADRWETGPDLPAGRFLAALAASDRALYLSGGARTDYRSQVSVYRLVP
ncbi:hypothetical protein KUV62_20000 [Salipiger bermudensis]|uniref:Kelch repeat-containing protein n=1 Tax=Salipiger bermudensis TaxID=344736 RepID=UPI001C997F7C|nr:kelch repeat-containing protein [Salipiger bermudensis]MBY6006217.1 hypothetical protein [Salipiger bermudensis]